MTLAFAYPRCPEEDVRALVAPFKGIRVETIKLL